MKIKYTDSLWMGIIIVCDPKEKYDFDIGGNGRFVLKYVSVDYHELKNKDCTENH